jgi:predicted Zn-dependent protease
MFASNATLRLINENPQVTLTLPLQVKLDAEYQNFTRQPNSHVVIIDSTLPLAILMDAQRVVISCGMIGKIHQNSDLAFILAHEAGHLHLQHYIDKNLNLETTELEADQYAINSLIKHGYDLKDLYKLILKLQHSASHMHHRYPNALQRITQLKQAQKNRSQQSQSHIFPLIRYDQILELKKRCEN